MRVEFAAQGGGTPQQWLVGALRRRGRQHGEGLMSTRRMGRLWLTGLVLASCFGLGLLGAGTALAETVPFTKAECTNWSVPSGVHELTVTAVGGAGQQAAEAEPG